MLVTLVTNKEGRFPGFKAEFFQLPKMKGEQRSWPISPPRLSLPRATEEGGAAVAAVSLPGMLPGPGDLEAGHTLALGACLAHGALGCCNDVPRGGQKKNYVGLDVQTDVCRKHLIDLLGSLQALEQSCSLQRST